jgi:hypothetical protein
MPNPNNTQSTTLSSPESQPYTQHCRVTDHPPTIAASVDQLIANPNIPPFLKWGIQSLCVAYFLPNNRPGLFRALFFLAWRSFAIRSKPDQVDPAFEHFYKQAVLLDKVSVDACLKKLRYPGKI